MTNQLQFNVQYLDSHAFMEVEGEYELEAFLRLINSINSVGLKSESKKVICDIRRVEDMLPSDTDRFRMGTALADAVRNDVYVAGLAAPESINHFVELVANNRSAHFKVFSCQDAARQWLLEEEILPKSRFA
ncbi:MAG: hypothetical protein ACI85F_001523 [Bacteroidia bacterium]|jgi:hypothetical protein